MVKNHDCDVDVNKAIRVKNYRVRMDFWARRLETDKRPRTKMCLPRLSWLLLGRVLFLGSSSSCHLPGL